MSEWREDNKSVVMGEMQNLKIKKREEGGDTYIVIVRKIGIGHQEWIRG